MWGIKDNLAGEAYYNSIIELYSQWGVDYIKMDCAYSDTYLSEIDQINEAIKNQTRDIVLSMSPTNRDPKLGNQVKTNVTMYRINGRYLPKILHKSISNIEVQGNQYTDRCQTVILTARASTDTDRQKHTTTAKR